jgi:hypothetical protein
VLKKQVERHEQVNQKNTDSMEGNPKDKDHKEEDHIVKRLNLWGECMSMLISSILAYRLPQEGLGPKGDGASLGDDPDSIPRALELPISFTRG